MLSHLAETLRAIESVQNELQTILAVPLNGEKQEEEKEGKGKVVSGFK